MPINLSAPRKPIPKRKAKAAVPSEPARKRPLVSHQQQQQQHASTPEPERNQQPSVVDDDEQERTTYPEEIAIDLVICDEDNLKHNGRIVGRVVDAWDDLRSIIHAGILGHIRKAEKPATSLEQYRERAAARLFKVCPDVLDLLIELEGREDVDNDATMLIGAALDHGRKQTRTEDRGVVDRELVHWIKDFRIPSVKSERGFQDGGCGSYLCPADEDWDDPMVRMRLRKDDVLHDRLPRFLWPMGEGGYDSAKPWDNFCRSDLLVKGVTSILVSRTLARGSDRSTRHSVAELYDIDWIDVPMIVYVATQIEFGLRTQAVFSAGPGQIGEAVSDKLRLKAKRNWPFRLFYYQLMHDLEVTMPLPDRQSLLQWWNDLIFPHDNGSTLGAEPVLGDLRARMQAEAEERNREYANNRPGSPA